MILSALQASFYTHNGSGRYSTPTAWRAGEQHPKRLISLGFRDALQRDWRQSPDHEVWLYPLAAQGGPALRPSKQNRRLNFDIIERELGITLFTSGIFIDLDDEPSHAEPHLRTGQAWFDRVESKTQLYRNMSGCFYYRTLRGARIGLIFEQPVSITTGDLSLIHI